MARELTLRVVIELLATMRVAVGVNLVLVNPSLLFVLFIILAANVCGQRPAANNRCPVFMRVPGDLRTGAASEDRLWFVLRQCSGETVWLTAYERHNGRSVTIDTGYTYPSFIAHAFNILVLESFGGSADHVLVVGFRQGKASVLLNRSAIGPIQIHRGDSTVTIAVPPKTYPDAQGRFPKGKVQRYTFDLEL